MKKKITIEGMSCGQCAGRIIESLKALVGVSAVDVNLDAKFAVLDGYDVDDADITFALGRAGYKVYGIEQFNM